MAGFVSAVRGGVLLGDFLAVAQRAILVLAETCQTAFFDPILLSCAKKSGVEPPRRSCLGAAALRRSSNKRAAALLKSWGF